MSLPVGDKNVTLPAKGLTTLAKQKVWDKIQDYSVFSLHIWKANIFKCKY